MIDFSFLL